MEVRPGYKRTEVGIIPEDWDVSTVGQQFSVQLGKMLDAKRNVGVAKPYLGNRAVQWNRIDIAGLSSVPLSPADLLRFHLEKGDLLACEGGEVGRAAIWDAPLDECYYQKALHRLRPLKDFDSRFMVAILHRLADRGMLANYVTQTSIAHLPRDKFIEVQIPLPPVAEQHAVATAFSDVDALLGGLDRLIAKKHNLKQAAMQQLLTGQTRLPGFHSHWEMKRIDDIALPVSEKNTDGMRLPVLTCSKHFGFMDSLSFFKNQVFSHDLSTYKVIRRDEIGYPANHIEEGSIGLQNIYGIALVSPIYVVFRVTQNVSSFFLHRLLKLDSYRQRFKTATTSSIDRRGSLRWPVFSEITVKLPPTKIEQIAIATVVADMERELAVLEARRDKTRDLKQAMMQELLTGKTRLVAVGGAHA